MKVLRVKIYQPSAQYRIPFSYSRKLTYPIPPFSTVKGFLCNVLGVKNEKDKSYEKIKEISLAIFGKYESLVKEYIWFRNLDREAHKDKFGFVNNRVIDFTPQHPGGQMPAKVDTLENVQLVIYVYHEDENFLRELGEAIDNPKNRNTVLHLGRAEDWLVVNDIRITEVSKERKNFTKIDYFTWVPSADYVDKNFIEIDGMEYEEFFKNIRGNFVRVPTFYEIIEGQRIFTRFVLSKLFEKGFMINPPFYHDEEEGLPVIFTKLNGYGR